MSEFLSQGLDYYKATMGQLEYEKHPNAQVTFALKNRSPEKPLSQFVTPDMVRERLATLQRGWQPEELAYLAGLQNQNGEAQFSEQYLDYLADNQLPSVDVDYDESGEIGVSVTGPWPLVTFWETVVMSELNELYFGEKLAQEGTHIEALYQEGDRRLDEKIARLQSRPDIKFSDFGTRRRFSYDWQKHVIERLAHELPDNFVGTSNIYLAHELGLKPIGTFAHELPMVYCALQDDDDKDPLDGHNRVLQDWQQLYKGDLSTALTDTYTSEFFFADMTADQAAEWKALRHDSGDPFEFSDRVVAFYESLDIDPQEKTIVFSDGLDIDRIFELADYCKGKINVMFGWGTSLTNDLGVRPNNIVMKAVAVNGVSTVKLSDNEGKHTGDQEKIALYTRLKNQRIGRTVLYEIAL